MGAVEDTCDQTMVTLEGFCKLLACGYKSLVSVKHTQGKLELRLDTVCAHLLDFAGKDLSRGSGTVNTVGLDGDQDTATGLEEPVGIHGNDTGLVGLGNIGEDDVHHGDNHTVASGLTSILNNGDHVGALGSHTDKVTARARRELNSVDEAGRANKVSNVGDGSTRGTTEVEDAGSGLHVDVVGTTSDGSTQLASEGVPCAVLDLGRRGCAVLVLLGLVDRDTLLAVYGLAGGDVLGRKTVFLAATDDEDTGVTVRLLE